MFLILSIALICLLITFSNDIFKLLHLGKLLSARTSAPNKELQQQLEAAQAELEAVKSRPSSGEYALFVKTMRAEQKIKDIEAKIHGDRNMSRLKSASVEMFGGYALKALLSLVLLGFSICYRYTPVIVFDDRFDFAPLDGLLSFPTGVPNAISVPVWALACNMSFRKLSSCIKRKK